jgi:hypothetical protein
MALPKIDYPTINIQIPPDNKTYQFRPMLVREEKVLLMAKVSEDETDMLQAIKQVVTNCSIDPTLDIDSLPLYVLEYLFVKLRGFSIGDKIDVSYRDLEDGKNYDFTIDLNRVEVKYPDAIEKTIKITDASGVVMKYPTAAIYSDKAFLKAEGEESFYRLIVRCIDQVYDADSVHEGREFEEEAMLEFLELIDIPSFEKIRAFMLNLPSLYYKIEYKNSNGSDRSIELKTLSDFFTLR